MKQLEGIKQSNGETVDQCYIRFKYLLKRERGDAIVPAGNQKKIFMRELKVDHIKDVTIEIWMI